MVVCYKQLKGYIFMLSTNKRVDDSPGETFEVFTNRSLQSNKRVYNQRLKGCVIILSVISDQ